MTIALDPVVRIGRDMLHGVSTLTDREARYLVDLYYIMQKNRIRAGGQIRAMSADEEPHAVLAWFETQTDVLEAQVRRALGAYAETSALGQWALSVVGIGPVIAAGLLAHIDIARAPTAGHIWRFAGLDPTLQWARGQKRPHNGALKTLCWKIGESFVKVKNHPQDYYGKVYAARREREGALNEQGAFAEQALRIAKERPAHAQIATYRDGKLPDGHLHSRAKRYAVKLFLSHYWQRGRELAGLPVPLPYPIAHQEHAHYVPIPEAA